MKQKKIMTLLLAFAFVGLSLGACSNTLDGIGQDVEHAGEKIQDTF